MQEAIFPAKKFTPIIANISQKTKQITKTLAIEGIDRKRASVTICRKKDVRDHLKSNHGELQN